MNRRKLALELHDLLGIPYRHSPTKGEELIRTVLGVVANALQRGESVEVRGFGKFVVRTRPPRLCRSTFVAGRAVRAKEYTSPAKQYVHFIPAASIEAWLNLQSDTPLNNRQQRAVKHWRQS